MALLLNFSILFYRCSKTMVFIFVFPTLYLYLCMCVCSHTHTPSVASNCLWPHRLQSTRFLCPQNFPGKNTGVGYHFFLQEIFPTHRWNPLTSPALAGRFFTTSTTGKSTLYIYIFHEINMKKNLVTLLELYVFICNLFLNSFCCPFYWQRVTVLLINWNFILEVVLLLTILSEPPGKPHFTSYQL